MVITKYLQPTSIEEAYESFNSEGKNYLVGGGAWLKLTVKEADRLIALDNLGLDRIDESEDHIEIGSMVTLRAIETSCRIKEVYGSILSQACHKIMGISIRNIATIGGSIMGKLAFSDLYPVLLAMKAKLVFFKAGEIAFSDFLTNQKREKDILLKVVIDKVEGKGFFKKVAITPLDFAVVNFAIVKAGKDFQISVGSTPYAASLAIKAGEYLGNQIVFDEEVIQKAVGLALDEIKVSDNIRGSKEYRIELIRTYLKRGIRQVTQNVG